MKNQIWSVAQQADGYATDIEVFTGPDARQKAEAYRATHGGALVRGEQMWNEPIGQVEDEQDEDSRPHVGASVVSGANIPEGQARPNKAAGEFTMSKKSKTPKAPKAKTKTEAAAKPTKTTVDAGGGILVDIVDAKPETPKAATATKAEKKAKAPKAEGKMSGLDAAAKVLAENKEPMACKALVEAMLAKGYWTTNGKTPASTMYSAILREIDTKPGESRFAKVGRGLFGLTSKK